MPLVEFILPLYANENTKYWRNKVNKAVLGSFKLFMGLSKNTPDKLTQLLLGYDFHLRAYYIQNISREKWNERRKDSPRISSCRGRIDPSHNTNWVTRSPNELITFINLFNTYCPHCHCMNNISHLRSAHSYKGPDIYDLLYFFQSKIFHKQKRITTINLVRNYLTPLIFSLRKLIKSQSG